MTIIRNSPDNLDYKGFPAVIRLETVRRLQEVTYADLAEREYGYATGSRRLIGPKKRQNTKKNRIFGGQISASIFGVFGCFFLRPSVRLSVRHSGTALRLSRAFERSSWPGSISFDFTHPAPRRKQSSPIGLGVRLGSA